MDPDTFRSDIGVDVYWRRRMAALVGVLVVVAFVAWACSASGPDGESRTDASASSSPTPDPILALLPTVTITPSPATSAPAPSAKPTVSAKPKTLAKARRPGDACDPSDLVLDMQGQGEVYAGDNRPRFVLTLVNTSKVMCTADVGSRALEVRITSGADRVWSSADCVSGESEDFRRLDRGIPYVRQVEWDRHRSGGDCATERVAAKAGTYVAMVHAPSLRSHKSVFHLR
ncbi:hypothetical protein AB0395_31120 [Streptosporangium sp. NPDC051023]|uniref:hypothetical protein n=1 Tax=Streptosporangium sp. NPDC051023 TaxID=3155410 RepID=UPI00344C241C